MNSKNVSVADFTEAVGAEQKNGHQSVISIVLLGLALWLGLVCVLGYNGAFVAREGSPPLPIFVGVAIPLAVFFTAYFKWTAFRDFILSADLRFVVAIQAWRWAGQHFLFLYGAGVLPALFAFPAAFGDMAIGFTAPWIVWSLVRNPQFVSSRQFVTWNILGIGDFVFAIVMAVLSSGQFHQITRWNGGVTTKAMAELPLIITPAYLVPFFCMLHFTALFQAQHSIRLRKSA